MTLAGPGGQCDEVDKVNPNDLLSSLVPGCTIGLKALSPAAKGRQGDIDIRSDGRFIELFPAVPGIVASATVKWMRSLAMRLLELPG